MNTTPPSEGSNELEEARQEIDRVDQDLVRLLKERMDAVEKVAPPATGGGGNDPPSPTPTWSAAGFIPMPSWVGSFPSI